MSTSPIYTPTAFCTTQDNSESSGQVRLLLMGPPKWGKTWSALTFPNPVVLDFDRGLTNPPANTIYIPFWNKDFVKTQLKQVAGCPITALTQWLNTEAEKLSEDQTLFIDSLSTLADSLTDVLDKRTPVSKNGEKDGFWFWKEWSVWLRNFCVKLQQLRCNVVVTCHEEEIRDSETGRVLSYKWMLKGKDFSARLSQYFTDVFRQTRIGVESAAGPDKTVKYNYYWQVAADSTFPLCCTRIKTSKKMLPATYSSFSVKD